MTMMKAIAIREPGGPEVLVVEERPIPEPKAGEIIIRVHAAGVNRPDALQRAGAYPPPPGASDLPGLEVAGIVHSVGEGVTRWAGGEAVCALTPGGGYAQFCAVPAGHVLPKPENLSFLQAAALPETTFTVWHNAFQRGGLSEGEWLLVHGGTSGIGTTAIQLAKAFGARVIATAGTAEKCKACLATGADHAINYRESDFVEAVKEMTGGQGANLILDMVGGDYVPRNYRAAAADGRIVQISTLAGPKAEADFRLLMAKRLTHTGSTLRPRTDAFKTALAGQIEAKVWPLIAAGRYAPVMDTVFALAKASSAHARMEGGNHIGKMVLEVA